MQDQSNWDMREAVVHQPVKNPRAIVSVAFSRAEFEEVVARAQQAGMRTSQYIRQMALIGFKPVLSHSDNVLIIAFEVSDACS